MQDKFEENIKTSLQKHEMQPPPMAWENISAALRKEKPKAIPWAKWMGIAAAVMIPALVAIGFWLSDYNDLQSYQGLDEVTNQHDIVKSTYSVLNPKSGSHDTKRNASFEGNNSSQEINAGQSNENEFDDQEGYLIGSKKSIDDKKSGNRFTNFIAKTFSNDNSNNILQDDLNVKNVGSKRRVNILTALVSPLRNYPKSEISNPNLYAQFKPDVETDLEVTFLNATEDKKVLEQKDKTHNKRRKFEFSPYAGTVFMGSFDQASFISPEFNRLKIENPLTASYGAKAAYNINNDLKLRTGVGVIDMRQNTYDVPLAVNTYDGAVNYNLKSYSNIGVNLSEYGNSSSTYGRYELDGGNRMIKDISQELQFIEVPVEMEYQLTHNKKMNVAATGGMSTLFLNKNDVYLKDQNAIFAKSTNMKSVSFSANAGVKLDYALSDKLSLNIEPQVKYMINTVTANKDLQPYLLAINAGVSLSL